MTRHAQETYFEFYALARPVRFEKHKKLPKSKQKCLAEADSRLTIHHIKSSSQQQADTKLTSLGIPGAFICIPRDSP
jgi:hypothetical protein